MSRKLTLQKITGLCNEILQTDSSIRYAGIANKMGKKIVAQYRNGVRPLLTDEESELEAIETVLSMSTRTDMSSKLGKPIYSFTLYRRVKMAEIFLDDVDHSTLMMSFDVKTNHEPIILDKILPLVEQHYSTNKTK